MKSSILFLFILFILSNRAYSKEIFKEVRKGKVVEPRYHFNHPPSVEYYNPIPVAVVYEDNNFSGKADVVVVNESSKDERKGKTVEPRYHLNHPPSVENYNPIPVAIVYEDSSTSYSDEYKTTAVDKVDKYDENKLIVIEKKDDTATKHEQGNSNTSKISVNNKPNIKSVPKSRALNNWQIPVAILYESGSNNVQNQQKRKTDTSIELKKSQSEKSGNNNLKERPAQISKKEAELQPKAFMKRIEGRDPVVPILEMENYVFSHNGDFHYRYESGDGTKAFSEGKQIIIDKEAGESVVGGFSYKDKEGNDVSLTYTADENGYRPVGAHLPTPPPIPPAIARALKYLATATPEPVTSRPKKSKALDG